MFRMMKLRQNVKGKVLSFGVSLSVLALTIVGAFAVSFKRATATPSNTIYTWSQLADLVYDVYPNNEIIEAWFDFFSGSGTTNNALDFDIFNNNSWLVIAALGSEPSEIAISVWEWTLTNETHTDGWSVRNNVFIMKNSSATGGVYHLRGYFFSNLSGYHCDKSRSDIANYNVQSSSPVNDIFSWSPASDSQRYWTLMPNTYNITDANWTWLTSRPIYNTNSSVINYPQTLVGAPISRYNNVCFSIGNQYYFTFSDQSILQSFIPDLGSAYVPVTFQKNGSTITYNYYFDELYYTGRSSVNGVTNVGAGGVLAWNITPLVNEYFFDSVVHSHVEPSEVYRDFFANNEAIISWVPYQDPAAQYEYYLQQFQNAMNITPAVIPNNIPSYVSQQTTSNYPGNVKIYAAGALGGFVYLNELPSVSFDQVLVIDEKAFDVFSLTIGGTVSLQEDIFKLNYLTELMQQSDLICIVSHSDFNDIIDECYSTHPDHFLYFTNSQWSWNQLTFEHGLWYMTSTTDEVASLAKKDCVSLVTNRYLQHVNNWILSDGVDFLYNALNGISNNQNNFFNGALNSIGAAIFAIDTVGGKLDNIYKYLRYDVDLSNKLTTIVDKLEQIADNTSEQSHDYWFISLYNWLLQFAPSNSDFANWVSDITSFENSLPDPEATPAATIIPFPTVTASAG